MFDAPMATILEQIPLPDDLKNALSDPESDSPLAESLRIALSFEGGRWDKLESLLEHSEAIGESYLNAVKWADEATSILAA
jgi:c-di-GMP-related signal transduction protein